MTTEKSIEIFLNHCRYEKNLNSKTLKAYTIDFEQFQAFLIKQHAIMNPQNIDKFVIKDYLKSLSKYEPKTIKRKIATIKALFNFLEFEDLITLNPFRKVRIAIREDKRLPVCLTNNEVKKIFEAAYGKSFKIKDKCSYTFKENLRDIAVLELLFATGIRVSELCELKKVDVNTDSRLIKVFGKGRKERIIHICNSSVLKALRDYLLAFKIAIDGSQFFFINRLNRRLSEQSVRLMIRKYVNEAKINKHVTPHTFRHTFATLLLEEDVDIKYIQKFLGHSSILTTQIYTHVNNSKQKQILTTKHPRGKFEIVV